MAKAKKPPHEALNDREALAEAQRLWGEFAMAWHPAYARERDCRHCCVGLMTTDVRDEWLVYGHGETWESAFEDAKNRKH